MALCGEARGVDDGLLYPAKNPVCLVLVGVRGNISWMALDMNSADVLKTLLTPLAAYMRGSGWNMWVGRWGT